MDRRSGSKSPGREGDTVRVKRRWRHFETPAGRRPALEFIRSVSDLDKAAILAAMAEVRRDGMSAARHLDGDIYEVRADGDNVIYPCKVRGDLGEML